MRNAAGVFRDVVHQTDPALASSDPLRIDATANRKHLKAHAFWKFLDEHGIAKAEDKRRAAGRYRRFPPLAEARRIFREKHPWWSPFDDRQANWEMPHEMVERTLGHNLLYREEETM